MTSGWLVGADMITCNCLESGGLPGQPGAVTTVTVEAKRLVLRDSGRTSKFRNIS